MKITINTFITIVSIFLVVVNVVIFVKGIALSEEVSYYEDQLVKLRQENIEIEQEIYTRESITKTASVAASLDYGKFNKPIFTDKPAYALNNGL